MPRKKTSDTPTPVQNSILSAHYLAEQADRDFLTFILSQVQLRDFAGTIPINRFKNLRLLAILDLLYEYSDPEIIALTPDFTSTSQLSSYRDDPHYETMTEAVKGAVEKAREVRTVEDVVKAAEGRVALGLLTSAAIPGKNQVQAMREVVDRARPKAARAASIGKQVNLVIPPSVVDSHRAYAQIVEEAVKASRGTGDIEIDGSVLNVPSTPSGDTDG